MTYVGEIGAKWRFLVAASLGQGAGYPLTIYVSNIFTPHLLKEFGWARSDFALVNAAFLLGILVQPITGRLGDLFGVRRVAAVGVIAGPALFIGLSLMTGALWQFFILTIMQLVLTSGAASTVIYTRLITKHFEHARGISLGVAASTAPLLAAIFIPWLSQYIDADGWRAGYVLLAVTTAIAGLAAIALIPCSSEARRIEKYTRSSGVTPYGSLLRSRTFRLLVGAVLLCMLSFSLQTTQLKVILLDRGMDSATASSVIAMFALSTIIGRLVCGLSLDRFPPYVVAAASLALPGVGLTILAVGATPPGASMVAVVLLGLSLGAEADVWPVLVTKYFGPDVYGTALGLMLSAVALSTGTGALLLSLALKLDGGFTLVTD